MSFAERLKGVAIAIGLLLLCAPVAVVLTILTASFWAWVEAAFGVEAYGHSGPAEWCYLVVYGVLVVGCTWGWSRLQRGT